MGTKKKKNTHISIKKKKYFNKSVKKHLCVISHNLL